VQVLQGIAFVLILASEALRGVDWKAAGERFRKSAVRGDEARPLTPTAAKETIA
jgi:simple sugar transport system permease protein